eukprot:PhM_4_TR1358/c0_g1_i1/m.44056
MFRRQALSPSPPSGITTTTTTATTAKQVSFVFPDLIMRVPCGSAVCLVDLLPVAPPSYRTTDALIRALGKYYPIVSVVSIVATKAAVVRRSRDYTDSMLVEEGRRETARRVNNNKKKYHKFKKSNNPTSIGNAAHVNNVNKMLNNMVRNARTTPTVKEVCAAVRWEALWPQEVCPSLRSYLSSEAGQGAGLSIVNNNVCFDLYF